MVDYHEKIAEIQAAMNKAKYNKATEKWFALQKSEIAKLRQKIEKKASGKGGGKGFFVKKSGDASVVLVGFPSVGKSTLLNALTGAESKTGAYAFTTLDVVPGVVHVNHAKIQVLDVPGIISGAAFGKGRGKEVLAMARTADLVLFVVEALHPEHLEVLKREVYDVGIRIDQEAPDVKIVRKPKGGISLSSTVPLTKVDRETLIEILKSFKYMNVDVVIRTDITMDQFIDVLDGNKSYIPSVVAISKADLVTKKEADKLVKDLNASVIVSAKEDKGIDELKNLMYDSLRFVRIFLKEVNKRPDLDVPMVLKHPATLRSVCQQIHRDFVKKFRFARIWGKSAKFPGQQFQNLDKKLEDGDIVEVHVR